MSNYYYALGDKLSDTDPISNSVLISGLNFARDGANLLLPGRYPPACLGSYIHESIHHVCFRSPVGAAIALLYFRGFQRAYDYLDLGKTAEFDDLDVLEDIIRVETILHTMRPLAEGIALFGEFDAYPGESKSLSNVFRNASIAFAGLVPGWEQLTISQLLPRVLTTGRAQAATQRRKENLLMQGFSTKNGGYLPGYYLVKNLQLALVRHLGCDRLLDSEFYLNFLIHWFYGDFDLVEVLVDNDKSLAPFGAKSIAENDSINAISVAFQRRFAALFKLSRETVEAFDELRASEDVKPWWQFQLGMDCALAHSLEERVVAESNQLIDYQRPGTIEQWAVRQMCHDTMIRRNYMCVGSFREEIEILANGRLMLGQALGGISAPVIALGNSLKLGPWRGKATIDVLQSGRTSRVFFTVCADQDVVFLGATGDDFETEKAQLQGIDLSTASCRQAKELMRETIDMALPPDSSAEVYRSHYKEQFEGATDRMYRNWCGSLMALNGLEASISEERGALLAMCDGDTKVLRVIAALGCTGNPFLETTDIDTACALVGLSRQSFDVHLQRIERHHKFKFIYEIDRYFVLAV